jgi:phosphatidylserine decarboxylase
MHRYPPSERPRNTAFPIASAGYSFIYACAFVTAVFALLGMAPLALISLLATLFVCFFFRDPDRLIPLTAGAIVSPADGRVVHVGTVNQTSFGSGTYTKISIFMSVFNVHVNRIPCDGTIKRIAYYPGKFFSANLDKASTDNERNAIQLRTDSGQIICFMQIAGLIARRIICHIQENQTVNQGQRFGLICFGSRVDVYLPHDTSVSVAVGDRVSGGTSIIGYLHDKGIKAEDKD